MFKLAAKYQASITPTASPLKARKLKYRLPKSFRPTWCTSYSEFWNMTSLGYLSHKFHQNNRRTVRQFDCASQKNQEWQKICELQIIWQVYPRPTSASIFFCNRMLLVRRKFCGKKFSKKFKMATQLVFFFSFQPMFRPTSIEKFATNNPKNQKFGLILRPNGSNWHVAECLGKYWPFSNYVVERLVKNVLWIVLFRSSSVSEASDLFHRFLCDPNWISHTCSNLTRNNFSN
jgi:hypothetical protein